MGEERYAHIKKQGFISFTSISSAGQSRERERERERASREIRGGESMTE